MDVEPLSESGPVHEIGTPHPWNRFVASTLGWIVKILAWLLMLAIPSCIGLRLYLDRAASVPDLLGCYQSAYDTVCFMPDGHFEQRTSAGVVHNTGTFTTSDNGSGEAGTRLMEARNFVDVCPWCDGIAAVHEEVIQPIDEPLLGPNFRRGRVGGEEIMYRKNSADGSPAPSRY
ncbi:hypothetical protein [Massilia sp. CCM 8734]|uniref:hypothetical protein n=1 Tax=Massilia sp. CCM 8734 TaxID=2609283 RepID=UPI00141EE111|nr:hypothetical protein [Massilia sp. CCM 8734]NHZ96924.1 hypothetical protein [Massilia sp. CCM 8734]